jgi:curli biogenesis system outer membrane secretion channel CsgG
MRHHRLLLLASMLLVGTTTAAAQEATDRGEIRSIPRAQRPMVAVRDFEFQAQLGAEERQQMNQWTALHAVFNRNGSQTLDAQTTIDLMAKQLTTLMSEALQATGNFRLFERNQLNAATGEQDLGASARAKQGQGRAETGELTVARYVVTGAITKFGKSEKKKSVGGGVLGGVIKGGVLGGLEKKQTDYEIGITVKVLDATTGETYEIITVDGSATGNASRRLAGGGGTLGGLIGVSMSTSATGEREKRIAEAMRNAIEKAALKLVALRERGDLTTM